MDGARAPIQRSEYRRRETEILFGIELLLHRWGLSDFVLDEGEQVFRDEDGRVVLSRLHADRGRLLGRGPEDSTPARHGPPG
jgi:hypothetical protein